MGRAKSRERHSLPCSWSTLRFFCLLGYSRRFHFWAAPCQDAEHTYQSLIGSFEYFGGVTEEVLVDNQKAAVITHRVGEAVRLDQRFLDLGGSTIIWQIAQHRLNLW